jgi:hypothetical protein
MNNKKISRIISVALMGLVTGFGVNIMRAHEDLMSRDAFLAKQAERYDHHAAHPELLVVTIIVGLIMSCAYLSIYELLTLCISKILDKFNTDDTVV